MKRDELVSEMQNFIGESYWAAFVKYLEAKGYTTDEIDEADTALEIGNMN